MKKIHYLAADIFGYSYTHYQEKVSMNHPRFTKYMPEDVRKLKKARQENWTDEKIAEGLEMPIENVPHWKRMYQLYADLDYEDHLGKFFLDSLKTDIKKLQIKLSASDQKKLIHALAYRLMDFNFMLEENDETLKDYDFYFRYEMDKSDE